MKQTTRLQRIFALLLALMLLCSTAMPVYAADVDFAASVVIDQGDPVEDPAPEVETDPAASEEPTADPVSTEPPAESPLPEEEPAATPEPTETPPETEVPTATPEPEATATPEPTKEPEATPTATLEPEDAAPETEDAAPETEETPTVPPLEITDMSTTMQAKPGDVVDFFVETNQGDAAGYQWQRLESAPSDYDEAAALYPYGEGESTDYYFPLEGMTESQLLEINPDATWPGIEMYYDQLNQLAGTPMLMALDEDAALPATAPEVHIENGTPNYILDPEAAAAREEGEETGWVAIEGETGSVYSHTVTEADEYTSYRCVITPAETSLSTPETAEETETGAEEIISDSMHVDLPAEETPEEEEPAPSAFSLFSLFSRSSGPDVSLSDDNQWITGLTAEMEYITKDTYDAQNASGAGSAYWTRLSGGSRPDGSKYVVTKLTDGKMEVLSAWYGKTVYFRRQGESGSGTALDIPAYTGTDYQSGQKTLYKDAVKVFNAWVPDTGASFYATYLGAGLDNGYTPNGGHITIDKAPIDSFNRIPNSYLTNAEGDYIYDAVIIGAATLDEPDLSGAAAWALRDYIADGYGFLIGHDMIYGYGGVSYDPSYTPDPNSTVTPYYVLNTRENGHYNMAWLMGQNQYYTDASPYASPSMILCGGDYTDKSTLYGDDSGSSLLRIKTSGTGDPLTDVSARVPTNYPYTSRWDGVAFTAGCEFYGTPTHTNQQVAYGTIWVDYASNSITSIGAGRSILDEREDGLTGTNNFYLTSNGNLAMSQIGHKTGNKDIVRIDECYLLANTIFYISQRQQCQVCQSEQGGNTEIHFVHRISSAAELALLADQEKNWFTYPIDGCYMLTADITLPADWQPIEGFAGHFDADGHSVTYADGLAAENRKVFAQQGDGWNLGGDYTKGTPSIHNGTAKTTGVARVVGYLRQLFGASNGDGWIGYKVTVYGTDGQEYSCVTNLDGKYVISNTPTTGEMKARVWTPDGREVTEYGPIRVTVPEAFWDSDETTPLYLLNFTPKPVQDTATYEAQDARLLNGGVYYTEAVTDIQWQVRRGAAGDWINLQDVAELAGHYTVAAPQFHDEGDASWTETNLTLTGCSTKWDGWYFRAVFRRGDKQADTYSAAPTGYEGKLSVHAWPLRVVQAEDKEVWVGESAVFVSTADYWKGIEDGLEVEWEYSHTGGGNWMPVAGSSEFDDDGAPQTSSTDASNAVYEAIQANYGFPALSQKRTTTKLTIKNASMAYYGYCFRVRYRYTNADGEVYTWYSDAANNRAWQWDTNVDAYGEATAGDAVQARTAKLTVKPANVAAVLQRAGDEPGSRDHQIPDTYGADEYGQYAKLSTGSDASSETVTYTAILYYLPDTADLTPQWQYRLFGSRTAHVWDQAAASSIDSGIRTSVTNTDLGTPKAGDAYYDAQYDGWRAVKSVLTISHPHSKMFNGSTMTQYEFGCQATASYQTATGINSKVSTTRYGKLVLGYDIYLHHNGVNLPYQLQNTVNGQTANSLTDAEALTAGRDYSDWKYPKLEIIAPGQAKLNTIEVSFDEGCNAGDTITYNTAMAQALGLEVIGSDKSWAFVTKTKDSVSTAQWEEFLRDMTFRVYERITSFDPGSGIAGGIGVNWYGSEEQATGGPDSQPDGITIKASGEWNGHHYAVVSYGEGLTWSQARMLALQMYDEDLRQYGYLAHPTTSAEWNYIYDLVKTQAPGVQGWLGGYRDGNDWKWADGPEEEKDVAWWYSSPARTNIVGGEVRDDVTVRVTYSEEVTHGVNGFSWNPWDTEEPNDMNYLRGDIHGEDKLHYYVDGGKWNDYADNPQASIIPKAFVVEFGGQDANADLGDITHILEDHDRIGTQLPASAAGEIKVTVGDKSKVYDGTELMPDITITSTTVANPAQYVQAVYTCSTASAGYTPVTLGASATGGSCVIHTGNYTVTLQLTDAATAAGYGLTADSVTSGALRITKRPLTLTSPDNDRAYDGTCQADINGIYIADGLVGGDQVGLSATTAAGYYTDGDHNVANTGSWTVSRTSPLSLTGDAYGDYYIGVERYPGHITPRGLVLHSLYLEEPGTARNTKQYDGSDTATVSQILIDGIVDGDPVALDKTSFAGRYDTANAGETLTAEGTAQDDRLLHLVENPITRTEEISLVHDPHGNYAIAEEHYSGAICRRTISASVTNFTSVYGEQPDLAPTVADVYSSAASGADSNLTISELVADDELILDPGKGWFVLPDVDATTPAGSYPVSFDGLTEDNYPVLSNYIVWQLPGALTITPRPLIIHAGEYQMVYGDDLPAFTPVFEGFVNGDTPESDLEGEPVYTTDATNTSDVGHYEVKLDGYTPKDNDNGVPNYVVTILPGDLEITKRPIVITPDPDPTPDPEPVPTLRRLTVVKTPDRDVLAVGETVTYTLTVTNTGNVELADIPVRDELTNAAGRIDAKDGQGYTYSDGLFTIARLPVGRSITLTYTYTALPADAGKTLTNAAVATVPGNPEDPDDPGEDIPSNEVDVPVDPDKAPDPTPDPGERSVTVDKTADTAFAKVGDTITFSAVVTNNGSVDLTNLKAKDVLTNMAGDITRLEGEGYTWITELTEPYTGLEIGQAVIPSLAVGESVTLHFAYTVQEADVGKNLRDVVVVSVPGENPPDPADPDTGLTDPDKPVTPDEDVTSNEVVVPVDAAAMVAADPKVKFYGDPDPALTYTLPEQLVKPDDITGDLVRVPGEEAGVYPILQGSLHSDNYDITYIPAIFHIKPAALYLTADDKTKVYGEDNPALTAVVTGFRFDDTLESATDNNYTLTTPATRTSDVGQYPIIPGGLTIPDNGQGYKNYYVYPVNGTLTITPKPIVITPDPGGDGSVHEPLVRKVQVDKDSDRTIMAVGDVVNYTITVTNTGSVELQDFPVEGRFTGAGTITASDGQGYTWKDGKFFVERLPVGKSITLTCSYTAVAADAGKQVDNVAVAILPDYNPEDPQNPGYGIDPDKPINDRKEYPSNEVTVLVDPDKTPDPTPTPDPGYTITVQKGADTLYAAVGDTIHYWADISNDGSVDLADIPVRDVLTNAAGDITPLDGDGYAWQGDTAVISRLSAGESIRIRFDYTVQPADAGKHLRDVVVATITGPNPPDPNRPEQGIDPEEPMTPDKEISSNEIVVEVDTGVGVEADPQIKIYGDPDPELTYTLPEPLVKEGDIWGELTRAPGEDTGYYAITQGSLTSKNYDIYFIPSRLLILPAQLTITAEDKVRAYKQPDPPFTVVYDGFKFNDGPEDLEGELSVVTTAVRDSLPGEYPIIPSGNYSKNYTITYINGTLTILDNGILIHKVDAETGAPVEGAAFQILDRYTQEVIAYNITNDQGNIWFLLPYGDYYYQEITAPRGYLAESSLHAFSINDKNTVVDVTFLNEPEGPLYGYITFGKNYRKRWPQTGDDVDVQERLVGETYQRSYTLTTTTPEQPAPDAESGAWYKGKQYQYSSTAVDLVEAPEPATETRSYSGLEDKADLPEQITVLQGEEEISLYLREVQWTENLLTVDRLTEIVDLGYASAQPAAASSITLTAEDGTEVEAALVGIQQSEEYAWRSETLYGYFVGGPNVRGFWLGDDLVPYQSTAPTWQGYQAAVLRYLGLDAQSNRITGAYWADDWHTVDGEEVRTAAFTVERYCARYSAEYAQTDPDQIPSYSATAVYAAQSASGVYLWQVTEYYNRGFWSVAKIVGTGTVGVSLLILAVVMVLRLLGGRKEKEEATEEE